MATTVTFPNGVYVKLPKGKQKEYKVNTRDKQQKAVKKMLKHAFHFIKGADFPIDVVFPFQVSLKIDDADALAFEIVSQDDMRKWLNLCLLSVTRELEEKPEGTDHANMEADIAKLGLIK